MSSIPGNKFQRRNTELSRETLAPGTGTTHTCVGTLQEVYDTERLETMQISQDLQRKLDNAPGLLFAKVLIPGVKLPYVLPFKEPEDQVYLAYGNGFHLEGRTVKIRWQGMSIDSGVIELARSWSEPHINLPRETTVLSIGGLF